MQENKMLNNKHQYYQHVNTLLHFNKLLSSRIANIGPLYAIGVWLMAFFLGMIPIAAIIEKADFLKNIITCIYAVIYLYLMLELLILTFRFSSNTVILQDKLIVFPITDKSRYLYLLSTMLRDKKNIIFALPFAILTAAIAHINKMASIRSLVLFILFFIFVQIWILNIYLLSAKFAAKNRQNAPMIYPLLLMIYIYLTARDQFGLLAYVPIIGWPGKALSFEIIGKSSYTYLASGFYLLFAIVGLPFGWRLMRTR